MLRQRLHKIIADAVRANEIPYGLLLVRKDHKEFLYTEEGVNRDAVFRIYSMTKPVTSAAVMKLIEAGELLSSDPVSRFLEGFQNQRVAVCGGTVPVKREVTIGDLLNMTSGLVYGNPNTMAGVQTQAVLDEIDRRLLSKNPVSTREAANLFGRCALNFQPGESWDYGVSADILGAVIEVVCGETFGQFVERELLLPLEMYDTGFTVREENKKRLVQSFERAANGTLVPYHGNHLGIINAMDRAAVYESGGAGLTSTPDDYSHFAEMLLCDGSYHGRQILKERTVRYMTSHKLNKKQRRNLGWEADYSGYNYGNLMRILVDENKSPVIGTNGSYGWDGWMGTFFCNSPADCMTVLFFTQVTNAGWLPVAKRLQNVIFSELTH